MGVQFVPPHSGNPSYLKALSDGFPLVFMTQFVGSADLLEYFIVF